MDGLQVTQLNVDHTTENEDELFRLSQLGGWATPWLSFALFRWSRREGRSGQAVTEGLGPARLGWTPSSTAY